MNMQEFIKNRAAFPLEELAKHHALPAKIVEYRQYSKLKSTYIDALPLMVLPETGRVHTSFNQVVAATGRLSCLVITSWDCAMIRRR